MLNFLKIWKINNRSLWLKNIAGLCPRISWGNLCKECRSPNGISSGYPTSGCLYVFSTKRRTYTTDLLHPMRFSVEKSPEIRKISNGSFWWRKIGNRVNSSGISNGGKVKWGCTHACTLPAGILCFDSAINRREAAVKRIESQVRSADVVKWLGIRRTVSQAKPQSNASPCVTCFAIGDTTRWRKRRTVYLPRHHSVTSLFMTLVNSVRNFTPGKSEEVASELRIFFGCISDILQTYSDIL